MEQAEKERKKGSGPVFDVFSDEDNLRNYATQIIKGVQYLHNSDIVHRDIKPHNLMIDGDGNLKIIDFGLAQMFYEGINMQEVVGTAEYMAPEVLRGSYNKNADWWSVGCILYEMLVGTTPFYRKNRDAMFREIKRGTLMFPRVQDTPSTKEFRMLITKLLKKNPEERY